jgi:hypothetical protein
VVVKNNTLGLNAPFRVKMDVETKETVGAKRAKAVAKAELVRSISKLVHIIRRNSAQGLRTEVAKFRLDTLRELKNTLAEYERE